MQPDNLTYDLAIACRSQPPPMASRFRLHGAYQDVRTNTCSSPRQAMSGLLESPSDVTFFGHTHYQGGFSYRAGQIGVIESNSGQNPDHILPRCDWSRERAICLIPVRLASRGTEIRVPHLQSPTWTME